MLTLGLTSLTANFQHLLWVVGPLTEWMATHSMIDYCLFVYSKQYLFSTIQLLLNTAMQNKSTHLRLSHPSNVLKLTTHECIACARTTLPPVRVPVEFIHHPMLSTLPGTQEYYPLSMPNGQASAFIWS